MAHEKVYGVCENKCLVPVYSKEQVDDKLKSITKTITLKASNWEDNLYKVNDELITLESDQKVSPALDITIEQLDAYNNAVFTDGGQSKGVFIIKAFGDIPTIDVPVRVKFSIITIPTEINASDNVIMTTKNDTSNAIKFGIDKDGNYGYIKVGADSVTPFRLLRFGEIIESNNAPFSKITGLEIGRKYVASLLNNGQLSNYDTIFSSGAKIIDGGYVSFSQAWFTYLIIFEATEETAMFSKQVYISYVKVE